MKKQFEILSLKENTIHEVDDEILSKHFQQKQQLEEDKDQNQQVFSISQTMNEPNKTDESANQYHLFIDEQNFFVNTDPGEAKQQIQQIKSLISLKRDQLFLINSKIFGRSNASGTTSGHQIQQQKSNTDKKDPKLKKSSIILSSNSSKRKDWQVAKIFILVSLLMF